MDTWYLAQNTLGGLATVSFFDLYVVYLGTGAVVGGRDPKSTKYEQEQEQQKDQEKEKRQEQ